LEAVDPLYRVCLIGPECTGKSTIAARLAARYGTVWVPEYAREYAARVARPLTADDVEPIARGQIEAEDRIASEAGLIERGSIASEDRRRVEARRLLILDTDLVSTVVYARHYYGDAPAWIEPLARARLAHLYLLFSPDVEFASDDVRDPTADRLAIYDAMRTALDAFGVRYERVGGGWEGRVGQAISAIERAREPLHKLSIEPQAPFS
jgi:nicotinamide riboside kinase